MAKIIVLDDEPLLLKTVARFLGREGHDVLAAGSFEEISDTMHPGRFDVLLTDIFMPGWSGMDVLKEAMSRGCTEPVVLITGEPNLSTAGEAVRYGAFDYVPKPLTKDKLLEVVNRALRHVELVRERDRARHNELQLLRSLATIGESAAVLTHEIKTPLTNLNTALRAVADKLEIEHREVLEELASRLVRIQELMKRTLSFARPLELNLVPCEPCDVLGGVCAEFNGPHREDHLDVELRVDDDSPSIRVDRRLLEEVLTNLIQNAREASGDAGRVVVGCTPDDASGVRIRVDDDGPGIPGHRRKDLFKLFHTTKEDGTGIGLAFCRKVIDAHGGTLELVEGELGGACFEIELGSGAVANETR